MTWMKLETWRHWNNRSRLESMPRCSCQCVMQCSMPFSARALKKNIVFDVDIVVKNKIEMWFIARSLYSRVHFQVRVGVFSGEDKYLFHYLWYCDKKQIECGLAWFVLLSTTIHVITVVKTLCNKLSYITKRALCFSFWVRQQHTPMGK